MEENRGPRPDCSNNKNTAQRQNCSESTTTGSKCHENAAPGLEYNKNAAKDPNYSENAAQYPSRRENTAGFAGYSKSAAQHTGYTRTKKSTKRIVYARIFCAFMATYLVLMAGFSFFLLSREKEAAQAELMSYALQVNNRVGEILNEYLDSNDQITDLAKVKKELVKKSPLFIFSGSEMALFSGDYSLLYNTNDYWLCGYTEYTEGNRHYAGYGLLNPREWFSTAEIKEIEGYLYARPRPKKAGDLAGYAVHLQGFWVDNEMIIPDKITVNATYAHTFDKKGNMASSGGELTDDIVYASGYENTKGLPYFQHGHIRPEPGANCSNTKQAALRAMVIDREKLQEATTRFGPPNYSGEESGFLSCRFYLPLPYQNRVKVIDEQNYAASFWTVIARDVNIWASCSATLAFVWISCLATFLAAAFLLSRQVYKTDQEREGLEKQRREMTDALAHDLKTPLGIISGYAQNLQENIHSEKREYYAGQIQANIGRMDQIIRGMLEMTKLEADSMQLKLAAVSLREACREVVNRYKPICAEQGVAVHLEGDADAVVKADQALILRVIDNFFVNALEHTPAGGAVSIRIPGDRLEVHNSGCPIPEDKINEIWLPFKKADPARRDKKGTGLGLAIARKILELHGFAYGARNSSDGPVFWFRFQP